MKAYILIFYSIAMFVNTLQGQDIIINRLGSDIKKQGESEFKGEFQAVERGFFIFGDGKWSQTGANIGNESIITFLDDYSPKIENNGINYLTCTYEDVGWAFAFGPTVSDKIEFFTLPEVDSVIIESKEEKQLQKKPVYEYQVAFAEGVDKRVVRVQLFGQITTSWSESDTFEDTVQYTGSIQTAKNINGALKFDGFEINSSQSMNISSTVSKTVKESNTVSEYGSNTEAVTINTEVILTPATPRLRINRILYVAEELVTAKYYLDENHDGVADIANLQEVTFIARSEPRVVHVEEFLESLPNS